MENICKARAKKAQTIANIPVFLEDLSVFKCSLPWRADFKQAMEGLPEKTEDLPKKTGLFQERGKPRGAPLPGGQRGLKRLKICQESERNTI